MKEFLLRRMAIIVAVMVVVGGTGIATDAFAAHGGGGGGAFAGGHFGEMGGRHFGGAARARQFEGRAVHRRFSRVWGDGYYDGSGYYDPSTVAPDEEPTYPANPYPNPPARRLGCSTQTYKVPSKAAARLPSKWFAAEGGAFARRACCARHAQRHAVPRWKRLRVYRKSEFCHIGDLSDLSAADQRGPSGAPLEHLWSSRFMEFCRCMCTEARIFGLRRRGFLSSAPGCSNQVAAIRALC